jgi:hypothetical protein
MCLNINASKLDDTYVSCLHTHQFETKFPSTPYQFKTRFPVTTYHFENDRIMMHPDPSHHIIMTTGQYTKSKTQGRRVKVGAALVSAGFRFKHVKPEKAKQYIMESILQSDKKSSHTAS